jgi:hypothetical protein
VILPGKNHEDFPIDDGSIGYSGEQAGISDRRTQNSDPSCPTSLVENSKRAKELEHPIEKKIFPEQNALGDPPPLSLPCHENIKYLRDVPAAYQLVHRWYAFHQAISIAPPLSGFSLWSRFCRIIFKLSFCQVL